MKLKSKRVKSLALEGSSIPLSELKKGIVEAEKGPFYTLEQAKKLVTSWRKKKDSQ